MKTLEERVYEALLETALSNSEVARRCGVARSTVALWKSGHAVRSDNLTKLCLALGIDDSIESVLRPQQKRVVRIVSGLSPEHDDVLASLEKLLSKLEQ